ncbi:hypothetical protein BDR04DRAFT_1114738 [Suillus decipiens]|nr:hypothetical protein BDR04DRAFT_1114738 [Suillus decipiens]
MPFARLPGTTWKASPGPSPSMISTVNTTSTFRIGWIKANFLKLSQNLSSFPELDCGICMAIKTAAMSGIGQINGEIMETLWPHLNLISPAAQGMSSPHRQECLDYQMNDSNFCKMICMKRTLCRKYKLAKNGITESGRAFDRLDEAVPGHLKTEWLAQERVTQFSRIRDPAAMDLYDINIKKAPSKKEIELRLLEDGNAHNAAPSRRSVAMWISMGLAIKEAQIALLIEIRRMGRRPTKTQRLDIAQQ